MGKITRKKSLPKKVKSVPEKDGSVYETVIKQFSSISKSTGLVLGTNEVLRRLQRQELAAIFLFSKRASPPIYHTFTQLCRKLEIPLVTLEAKDKFVLGPQFPVSITYGVKKEGSKNIPALDQLPKKVDKKDRIVLTNSETSLKETVASKEEKSTVDLSADVFYHKKHVAKRKLKSWSEENILSIKGIEFPDYDFKDET